MTATERAFTGLLLAWREGDESALNQLVPARAGPLIRVRIKNETDTSASAKATADRPVAAWAPKPTKAKAAVS